MTILLPLAFAAALVAGPSVAPTAAGVERQEATAAYYFLLGRYYEGAGKVGDAIDALKQAIALEPRSAEPRAELAALYARQEKAQEAVDAAEDALRVDAKNREANRVLGSVLAAVALADEKQPLKPGDTVSDYPTRAIAALEIAVGDGNDLSIDLALARLYLAQNRPADAAPLLRHIVDDQPGYTEGWLLLAQAQEASGKPADAAETLRTVLQDQPQFFKGQVQLAELYDRQRQWTKAADAWARAQALNEGNPEVAARHASALMNAGRSADARDVLRGALELEPNDVRLSFMLAQAQRETGDLEGAESTARAIRSAHPDDTRATYLLAQMLEARERHRDVVDLLQPEIAKLRLAPSTAGQAALLLGSEGLALQQLHKYDEALTAFRDAVALAPDDPVRHVLLIQGYTAAGRTKDAIAEGERSRQAFPQDTAVVYQLGAAYDRAGRQAEAEKLFRDIVARDPLDAGALNYLGYMLAERGTSLDEAVSLIQRALRVEPNNPSYLDSLGWAYAQQGKIDLADPPLTTAAEKMPKNSVIQDHLGDLRVKQNRRADAIAAWQRALAGDGDSIDRGRIQKKIDSARKGK